MIARNLCLSELRKNKVRQRHQQDPFDRGQLDEETTLSLIELKARIKALPQEVQRCWLLFRMDGYTNEEIACLTGYSSQQVKNYLRVAREKLEKQMK
jgi:RNA polymerase sigma factor (sigma-70 family)